VTPEGETRKWVFLEYKSIAIGIHQSYDEFTAGIEGTGQRNWIKVGQQVVKYVDKMDTKRFVLSDYLDWAFVEIGDYHKQPTRALDYTIFWRRWNSSEPSLTVKWCFASFIMKGLDSNSPPDALDDNLIRIRNDVKEAKHKKFTEEERASGNLLSKQGLRLYRIFGRHFVKQRQGRPLSAPLLKFCSNGDLDYRYEILTPDTVNQITPEGEEGYSSCRTVELCGTIVLEKIIVKEWFPHDDFDGKDDPERERLAQKLLRTELWAYGKLRKLQGNVVPYLYGTVKTSPWFQHYRSPGILIEYLADYQTVEEFVCGNAPVHSPVPEEAGQVASPPSSAEIRFEALLEATKATVKTNLEQIHKAGVCHGDLKSNNILVASSSDVVYIDFGSSVTYSTKSSERDWQDWNYMWKTLENMTKSIQDTRLE
jgi:hypothetical protein